VTLPIKLARQTIEMLFITVPLMTFSASDCASKLASFNLSMITCFRSRRSPPYPSDDYSYSSDLVQDTKNRLRRLETEADVSCLRGFCFIWSLNEVCFRCRLVYEFVSL